MLRIRPFQSLLVLACLAPAVAPAFAASQPELTATAPIVQVHQPQGAVLYSQTDGAGTTATNSQNFEVANDAFDNELADDFVVPASGWDINEVALTGLYFNGPGPAPTVHVRFYSNSGTLPGAPVPGCDYPAVVPGGVGANFVLALSPSCQLTAGTYWVSVVANMNFTPAGQWGWSDRTITSNSPAAWRNPGGGFGIPGCVPFGARAATCGIGAAAPDQVFSLSGAILPVELMSFSAE
jgi:hypothetical protein